MRNVDRLGIVVGAVLLTSFVISHTAFAAAPTNDTVSGATAVTTFPFSDLIDTADATTDADDTQANEYCSYPATDASVWYTFTPAAHTDVWVDTTGSDYLADVIVATGSPGSLTTIACGEVGVFFPATAGATYYILVLDGQSDGGGNGGALKLWISETEPTPTATLTWRVSFEPKSGVATVSGTIVCEHAYSVWIYGTLSQSVGRFAIQGGFAFEDLDPSVCDGQSHQWSATVTNSTGRFAGGKGTLLAGATFMGIGGIQFYPVEQKVQLRGK